MEKQEVIERFCQLSRKVNKEIFKFHRAADCFCNHVPQLSNFQFEEEVIKFIEDSVQEAINKNHP